MTHPLTSIQEVDQEIQDLVARKGIHTDCLEWDYAYEALATILCIRFDIPFNWICLAGDILDALGWPEPRDVHLQGQQGFPVLSVLSRGYLLDFQKALYTGMLPRGRCLGISQTCRIYWSTWVQRIQDRYPDKALFTYRVKQVYPVDADWLKMPFWSPSVKQEVLDLLIQNEEEKPCSPCYSDYRLLNE